MSDDETSEPSVPGDSSTDTPVRDNLSEDPSEIDRLVARRVRFFRQLRGLSQRQLGEAIGITITQMNKYERAQNRFGARRIYEISKTLDVKIDDFFGQSVQNGYYDRDKTREYLKLIDLMKRIRKKDQRRAVRALLRALGNADGSAK
jgi:transcriptional regulator with XRE-family HTH domain